MNSEYIKHAQDCDAAVPGPDTPFQTRLNEFGTEGRVLAPVVGTWCETSDDFDLLIELIAHALADNKETSMLLAHDQAVARQRQKLTADCKWLTGVLLRHPRGPARGHASVSSFTGLADGPLELARSRAGVTTLEV